MVGTDSSYQNNIDDITFTPDGALLLASAYDGKARSYNLAGVSEKVAKALASQRQATAPAASVLPRPQLLKHSGSANVYALSLSEDGRLLITVSGDQSMKVWRR